MVQAHKETSNTKRRNNHIQKKKSRSVKAILKQRQLAFNSKERKTGEPVRLTGKKNAWGDFSVNI